MDKRGAFPSQDILHMIGEGWIEGVEKDHVRPGSFDLALAEEGYRVQGAFLPRADETVLDAIKRSGATPLSENPILERGTCYVFRLQTKINRLTSGMYGYCNPKSSSGRIDIHVRVIADYVSRYDYIPTGYTGPLWIMIVPRTFPIISSPGTTLNQVRLCTQDTRFDETRLELNFEAKGGMIFDSRGWPMKYKDIVHSDRDGSILLTLGLEGFEFPGWEAVDNGVAIDLAKRYHYNPKEFFRPIVLFNHSITLREGAFYILSTKEYVRVASCFACEMRPMDDRAGDLRSHYAGFVDPGWGCGEDDRGRGRPLTLEVRSFEKNLIIRDGQPISKIRYERMYELPEKHYDQMSPTYGGQSGPKLGKYFKDWK